MNALLYNKKVKQSNS